jgi:hypothetical protein
MALSRDVLRDTLVCVRVCGAFPWGTYRPKGPLTLLARLDVHYNNGTTVSVSTDTTWRVGNGSTLHNNPYLGAVVDNRLEQTGWNTVGFDDSTWSFAVVRVLPCVSMCVLFVCCVFGRPLLFLYG